MRRGEPHMKKKARLRIAKLIKHSQMDRSFDLEFWKKLGAEARFNAAWQMVLEVNTIKKKKDVYESRLQRSVQTIIRQRS